MESMFLSIISISLTVVIPIIVIIILRIFRNKLSSWLIPLMWITVFIRCLLPSNIFIPIKVSEQVQINTPSTYVDRIAEQVEIAVNDENVISKDKNNNKETDYLNIFSNIWFIGTAIMIFVMAFLYISINLYLKDKQLISPILLNNGKIKIPKKIPVYTSTKIKTPVTIGIFKPKIILPEDMLINLNFIVLSHVLKHESVHIKRFDNFWGLISLTALCFYWFNPFVWIGYILFCSDIETSCDNKIITQIGRQNRSVYANSIINLAVTKKSLLQLTNISSFSMKGVKKRVKHVMSYKKIKTSGIIISVFLIIMLIPMFLIKLTAIQKDYLYVWEKEYYQNIEDMTVGADELTDAVLLQNKNFMLVSTGGALIVNDLNTLKSYDISTPFNLSYIAENKDVIRMQNEINSLYYYDTLNDMKKPCMRITKTGDNSFRVYRMIGDFSDFKLVPLLLTEKRYNELINTLEETDTAISNDITTAYKKGNKTIMTVDLEMKERMQAAPDWDEEEFYMARVLNSRQKQFVERALILAGYTRKEYNEMIEKSGLNKEVPLLGIVAFDLILTETGVNITLLPNEMYVNEEKSSLIGLNKYKDIITVNIVN